MTQLEERDYKDLPPGSWSEDLDRLLEKFGDERTYVRSQSSKVIVMGKAKVIVKRDSGDTAYRVTFHETWTRLE